MNRDISGRLAAIAAAMVGVGALISGAIVWGLTLASVSVLPRFFFVQDPIGWAFSVRINPLMFVAMLVALVLLVGATWLFVRLVARAAAPGRAAAVFFGTWGAIVVAAWIAGLARAPIALVGFRIPMENVDLVMSQFYQLSTQGIAWAVTWGWLTALVAALVHRAATRTTAPADAGLYAAYPAAPATGATYAASAPEPPAAQPPAQPLS